MKILIIEDEKELAGTIKKFLEPEGYLCETASSYFEAEDSLSVFNYDIIILDLTLPGGDGLDLIKLIKNRNRQAGLLIVSAKNSLDDKIRGLDMGADDYITKPFHLAELNSRIKSLARRRHFDGANELIFNEIRINIDSNEVFINGTIIDLTKKEYEILVYFIVNRNRVITRESIAEHVWGDNISFADNYNFILSFIFKDQLNEKLIADIESVKLTIERNGNLPDYYPFIESREVPGLKARSYETKDTLIFDMTEKENIPFRQISLVTTINGKEFFIAARDTLLEKSDLLATIAIVITSVFILLLLSLYFINRKLSLNIWEPFYKTLDELKEFSHDKPDFRLSSGSPLEEFTDLNNSLEKLTQKVITDYQSLKRFTEDASHEIQTPLSVIQSKLETMMQYPDLKKEQADLINSAYSYTLRISKLTHTLLLLTKIANDQFPERRAVNLSTLLDEKIALYDDNIIGKSLIIKKEIEPECIHETNFFLAESLILNLIGNAVKHSTSGGTVNIKLDKSNFEISNPGEPLSVPASKLFDRFFKTDKYSDSNGLGLAIVKEICRLNKWEIKYEYEDGLHKVIVKF
ncbi:MAG: response regulator [Bacteroidia bacterium]|nr:response regulator [Bacteroidia bacterium]